MKDLDNSLLFLVMCGSLSFKVWLPIKPLKGECIQYKGRVYCIRNFVYQLKKDSIAVEEGLEHVVPSNWMMTIICEDVSP